jgi:hypothetical protein
MVSAGALPIKVPFEDIKPDVSSRERLPAFGGLPFPIEVVERTE